MIFLIIFKQTESGGSLEFYRQYQQQMKQESHLDPTLRNIPIPATVACCWNMVAVRLQFP